MRIFIFLCFFIFLSKGWAQLLPERLVSVSGGMVKDANVQIDYTIGELANTTFTSAAGYIHEGLLQWYAPKQIKSVDQPNVFVTDSTLKVFELVTPNGDDKNDFFFVNGIQKYPENELMIVNKWGDVVYKTTHYNNTWNGNDLPAGSYFYVLKISKEGKVFSGGFTLAR